MLISNNSRPEFDPYHNDELVPESDAGPWRAPTASAPLAAELSLPGSKSLTNRELVLSALADSPSTLRAPLHSRDSALMVQALRALGTQIDEGEAQPFGPDLHITPGELAGGTFVDCGLAGTVMRFLPPVAALALGPVAFDGDEYARRRPMRTTIQSLRDLGVDISDDGRGTLPFSLYGTGSIVGGDLAIDASASSQFVSGLLLTAPRFERGLTLTHTGDTLPSMPHIDMTVECLRQRGVTVHSEQAGQWRVEPGPIAGHTLTIEPDLSNAAPFLVAAVITGGTVTIRDWPETTTQVGALLATILPRFGATVTTHDGMLTVDGGDGLRGGATIPGVDLDLSAGGELAPALIALAALATTPSTITGIGHLRGHETDRLAALSTEINKLGGHVTELADGLHIEPRPLHGGLWQVYDDHRMATAGAILGLAVPEIDVDDIGATAKTLPQFSQLWRGPSLLGIDRGATDPLSLL